jgi:predicted metal-dependent phosphoesterase TrpH
MARVDMHVHSSASFDCDVPPHVVAHQLGSYGLSPVFLTDHDTLDGVLRLRDDGAVRVVVGQEITTSQGELIGLFLTDLIPAGLEPEEAIRRVKAQQGLVYLQHPFDERRRSLLEGTIERVRDSIDIVEVFNGRSSAEANRRAEDLCAVLGAVAGAGSDAHSLAQIGRVYVELGDFSGPQDFLMKLGAGRIVSEPPRWRMRFEAKWKDWAHRSR